MLSAAASAAWPAGGRRTMRWGAAAEHAPCLKWSALPRPFSGCASTGSTSTAWWRSAATAAAAAVAATQPPPVSGYKRGPGPSKPFPAN